MFLEFAILPFNMRKNWKMSNILHPKAKTFLEKPTYPKSLPGFPQSLPGFPKSLPGFPKYLAGFPKSLPGFPNSKWRSTRFPEKSTWFPNSTFAIFFACQRVYLQILKAWWVLKYTLRVDIRRKKKSKLNFKGTYQNGLLTLISVFCQKNKQNKAFLKIERDGQAVMIIILHTGWLPCHIYRLFIKYCVFSENIVIFLNSAAPTGTIEQPSGGPSLKFGVHMHTETSRGKPRKTSTNTEEHRIQNVEKKTIFNKHPVHQQDMYFCRYLEFFFKE